jgi:hypothetical protein
MKPETVTESIQQALGDQLLAVVLYGSSAAGDYIDGRSDYNILLLAKQWRSTELNAMRGTLTQWLKTGNPAPLCFTPERFRDAADVFPMEMLDIAESHRVLYGKDPVKDIKVDLTHLRHQVEFELRSKLLKLRQAYLQLRKPDKDLHPLLVDSLSSFQVVCRGALRLFSKEVPADKFAATHALGKQINVAVDSFETIYQLKKEPSLAKKQDMTELFDRYLSQIEMILDHINATTHT